MEKPQAMWRTKIKNQLGEIWAGVSLPSIKAWAITAVILGTSTGIGFVFHDLKFTEANIITIYILGALLTALFTMNYICSAVFSLASVILFNFFFTEPRLSLMAYESGYPVTFAIMLLTSLITGTLAIERVKNAQEKEEIAMQVKDEQLRANLLRSISHDLRTPLTSIAGNAENLLSNFEKIDAESRQQILKDVYSDSRWLITLVENLLSITRISEGRMELHTSTYLVAEVIQEALHHVDRAGKEHEIVTDIEDEFLLAKMDARLIQQVLINLVDNAIKYTKEGSKISIRAYGKEKFAVIEVKDNGPGIPEEQKSLVFQMFYTGEHKIVDSRRSLGLGLALCESIVHAHGGEITLQDNKPQGASFSFTLPISEVNLNE